MEKSWENFWTTGKVEDYLTYCNRLEECKYKEDGVSSSCDANCGGAWREEISAGKTTDTSSWK